MNGKVFWARQVWQRQGRLGATLGVLSRPMAVAYSAAIRARNLLYQAGCLPTRRLPRTVISIGNLTVGGTSKTPTTVWLAQALTNRGHRVAILTRGYRRGGRRIVVLSGAPAGTDALLEEEVGAVGDEAWMMARLFGQTVAVGRDRYQSGTLLLQQEDVDVFLLDDGFQHRRLKRDVDVVLLGEDHGQSLLPAGPLREPVSAIGRADFVVVTGAQERWQALLRERFPGVPVFLASARPRSLRSCEDGEWRDSPLRRLAGARVVAVCGIAKPDPFYRMLNDWQAEIVDVIEFEDHHVYSQQDWQRINRGGRKADLIVTTEKDIVKLVRFPFARGRLAALRLEMTVERGEALVDEIEGLARRRMLRRENGS